MRHGAVVAGWYVGLDSRRTNVGRVDFGDMSR